MNRSNHSADSRGPIPSILQNDIVSDSQALLVDNGVTPSMRTMHQFALTKIQPESWLNIPICIVKALRCIIDNCTN